MLYVIGVIGFHKFQTNARKYVMIKKIRKKIRDLLNGKLVIWCGDLDF